jgi:hypothetical protein
MEIDPQYPVVSPSGREALEAAKVKLEGEAPKGAAADPFEAAGAKRGTSPQPPKRAND